MNAAARIFTGTHKFDRGLSRLLTAHWTQCAPASNIQALHHGAQLPARSSAAVLGRPLLTSLRRRFSAASQVRQSTTPGTSASPVANVRRTGFLCCWLVGLELELIAWQFERSECHQRQFPQTFENTFVRSCTEASSALEVLRKCAIQIYYLLTYMNRRGGRRHYAYAGLD